MNEPGQEHASLIWRPSVEHTQSPLPYPSTGSQHDGGQSRRLYTKTSLAHHYDDNTTSNGHQSLNRRILNASQSYNSTPRPFVRQASIRPQASGQAESPQPQSLPPIYSHAPSVRQEEPPLPLPLPPPPPPLLQSDNIDSMSPKLVHQQYNSPMNLYSMNNIRKTIEAHSELIAPGVKGINFMKADAPVNKQSEVLKLIKEQEEEEAARRMRQQGQDMHQRQQQSYGSPLSTGSSQQTVNSASQQQQRRVQYAAEQHHTAAYNHNQSSENYVGHQTKSILKQQQQPPVPRAVSLDRHMVSSSSGNGAPKCCFECGQIIVGPFARVGDRCVHPNCFNCSTCGTPLKNSGYFTINDKLYCEIHARQVANVMRLNYNFEPNKQAVVSNQQQISEQQRDERTQQFQMIKRAASAEQQVDRPLQENRSIAPAEPLLVKPHFAPPPPLVGPTPPVITVASSSPASHCSHCCSAAMRSGGATTISTMFSGTGQVGGNCQHCNNACSCQRRSEIRWTWRPAASHVGHTTNQMIDSAQSSASSSTRTVNLEQMQQQKNKYESRLQAANYSANSDRIAASGLEQRAAPVCCHCRVQIYGPYILAGNSTWCKSCSQTNFVCQSCHRSLLNIGFIEDSQTGQFNCEHCYETLLAPVCAKCNARIRGDCLNALGKRWHPTCFVCGHCRGPFGNSSFYLEDDVPYCERDWNLLFTTKCYCCGYPIEAGDKWIEALGRNYHSDCFRCTGCQVKLEGSTFYCKGGKPYCQMHAR